MFELLSLIIFPRLYVWLTHLVMCTCRVKWYGNDVIAAMRQSKQPWIWSCWHDNVGIAVWSVRGENVHMLASDSKNGEYMARGIRAFGHSTVRGSSSRGTTKATRGMLRALLRKHNVSITPDGPRGPRYKAQPGALWVSVMADSPIIPYHFEASRQWVVNSWDKHKIPKPFSVVHICVGEPWWVSRGALKDDSGAVLIEFDQRMMRNARRALRLAGRPDD
ncbi:MAG: lysophospholipid acyltransferase family protein [Arenicellaceae bacterium]|nr:lysophospholipid acyltransferase family protein [Arenicellaceae bacterium]